MGNIEVITYRDKDLTIMKIIGHVHYSVIFDEVKKYNSGNPTKYIIWDYREGRGQGMDPENIKQFSNHLKTVPESRIGGKTAIILAHDVQFGLGRMLESYLDINNYAIPLQSFRSIDDAYRWFGIEPVDENTETGETEIVE